MQDYEGVVDDSRHAAVKMSAIGNNESLSRSQVAAHTDIGVHVITEWVPAGGECR